MAKSKLTEVELRVKEFTPPLINYQFQKSVSYSQFSTYLRCPHQWYLTYMKNQAPFRSNIHTVFGDAMHETLQEYLTVMYNQSGAASDKLNLLDMFQERFITNYQKEYDKTQVHFTDAKEMREFYEDAAAILHFIGKNRNKIFTIRNMVLLGVELPLIIPVKNNLFLKGYIDVVLYDKDLDKIYIYDIKTSTRGWGDKEKGDITKTSQVILYKEYFAKQYNLDVEKIDVEFFIVKRKVYEKSEYPISRIQHFKPASGKTTRNKIAKNFQNFLDECFDLEGKAIEKTYIQLVSKESCTWCPYNSKSELCSKGA
jgi:hypothetical protein